VVEHRARHRARLPAILCWPGGKRWLVGEVLARIPPHRVYVEPLFGAGHVFWAKEPSPVEVISDVDGRLMAFYRGLAGMEGFDCDMAPSVERWRRLRRLYESGVELGPCDYLYLVKYSYACKMEHPNPGKLRGCEAARRPRACLVTAVADRWPEYRRRLSNATILTADWREVVERYDSPETFGYLDPPYFDISECPYVACNVHPRQISRWLWGAEGRYIVSYDPHPEVEEAFRGFRVEEVYGKMQLPYGGPMARMPRRRWRQLLIMNYEWPLHVAKHGGG